MKMVNYLMLIALLGCSNAIVAMNALKLKQDDVAKEQEEAKRQRPEAPQEEPQGEPRMQGLKDALEKAQQSVDKLTILMQIITLLREQYNQLVASSENENLEFVKLQKIFDEFIPIDAAISANLNYIMTYQVGEYLTPKNELKALLKQNLTQMLTNRLQTILKDIQNANDMQTIEALDLKFNNLCRLRDKYGLLNILSYDPDYIKNLDRFINTGDISIRQAKFDILNKEMLALQGAYQETLKSTNNIQKLRALENLLRQAKDLYTRISNLIPIFSSQTKYNIPSISKFIDTLRDAIKETQVNMQNEKMLELRKRYEALLKTPDSEEKIQTLWSMTTEANIIQKDINDITNTFGKNVLREEITETANALKK